MISDLNKARLLFVKCMLLLLAFMVALAGSCSLFHKWQTRRYFYPEHPSVGKTLVINNMFNKGIFSGKFQSDYNYPENDKRLAEIYQEFDHYIPLVSGDDWYVHGYRKWQEVDIKHFTIDRIYVDRNYYLTRHFCLDDGLKMFIHCWELKGWRDLERSRPHSWYQH